MVLRHDSSSPRLRGEVAAKRPERGKRPRRSHENVARAREFRHGDNMSEAILWNELKGRKLGGYKFVRQMPLGPYFADFVCRDKKLVVEIDGSQHAESDYDRQRDEFMRTEGYSTVRFWNVDVLKHYAGVCETILAALDGRLSEDVTAVDLRFVYARSKLAKEAR